MSQAAKFGDVVLGVDVHMVVFTANRLPSSTCIERSATRLLT
jgi:hypothetical protein